MENEITHSKINSLIMTVITHHTDVLAAGSVFMSS